MFDQLYDSILESLRSTMTAFGLAAEKLHDALLEEITEGLADSIDIRPLNKVFPQLHVSHSGQSYLATGFCLGGYVYATDTVWEREFQINGDISQDSIIDTITYLRSLRKEISEGRVVKRFDEENRELFLEYPDAD